MEVSASVGKARSSKEDEVWRSVPVCRVVEQCFLCSQFHSAYGKKKPSGTMLNYHTPGGALNHSMSGKTLNYRPSAKMKNITSSEMKSLFELHGHSIPLLFPSVSLPGHRHVYVVPGPRDIFVSCGCPTCHRIGPNAHEHFSSGYSYTSDESVETADFLGPCPCVEPRCQSWELVHGVVGRAETFSPELFSLLKEIEKTFPGVLAWLRRVDVDVQTLYARGAPLKVVRDDSGVVVSLDFVKMDAV